MSISQSPRSIKKLTNTDAMNVKVAKALNLYSPILVFLSTKKAYATRRSEFAIFHPTKWTGKMVNIFGCTLTSCKTAESLDTKPWTLHHKNEEMIVCWYGYFPDVSFSQIQLDALLYDVKLLTSGTSSHGYLMVGCVQNKGDVPLWKVIQMFKVSQSFYPAMCQPSSIYESVSKGILPWCHDVETSTAEIFI